MEFLKENWLVVTVVVGFLAVLIYRIDGFAKLLGKAIGTVLQQICSLFIEAICLVFKIINALEAYVVLLIDSLTGKTSSNGKIASLAIGVLSIASFYTTYSGMLYFVEENYIAFLITLGIQAILFSTSLRINDFLELKNGETSFLSHGKLVFILCTALCIFAYIVPVLSLSYSVNKLIYHIVYIFVISLMIFLLITLIKQLIKTGIKNKIVGMFLFMIYFAVLSVSSFFSYNAFVPVMYPEHIRNIDSFQAYRIGVIDLLEAMDENVNDDYYENIRVELEAELYELENMIANIDETIFLTDEEKTIYAQKEKFDEYIVLIEKKDSLEDEKKKLTIEYNEYKDSIVNSSIDIGPETNKALEQAREEYEANVTEIDSEISILDTSINQYDENIVSNVDKYKEILEKANEDKEELECSEDIKLINVLLTKDTWTDSERQGLSTSVQNIENARNIINGNNSTMLTNDFGDMINVYCGYKEYKTNYSYILDEILGVSVKDEQYVAAYNMIQELCYELLRELPETKYVFYSKDNESIQTESLYKSDYYSKLESLKRNANPSLSQIEKNIRTFIDNKLIGIVCALMAVLIDMMILFVGIIIPKGTDFRKERPYSDYEIRQKLSNLFNKPIRR